MYGRHVWKFCEWKGQLISTQSLLYIINAYWQNLKTSVLPDAVLVNFNWMSKKTSWKVSLRKAGPLKYMTLCLVPNTRCHFVRKTNKASSFGKKKPKLSDNYTWIKRIKWIKWTINGRPKIAFLLRHKFPPGYDGRVSKFQSSLVSSVQQNRVRYRAEHEKIKFISKSGHVTFCLLYKHQWKRCELLCNHNDGDLFMCEDNMLFSLVKIWSFRAKAHLVFH